MPGSLVCELVLKAVAQDVDLDSQPWQLRGLEVDRERVDDAKSVDVPGRRRRGGATRRGLGGCVTVGVHGRSFLP
jgi:hypothetical protein